jgi:hypothetical protein
MKGREAMTATVTAREAWRVAERERSGRSHGRKWAPRDGAGWLCLAATPTFVTMAVLAAVGGADPQNVLCAAAQDASPLTSMGAMYVLMAAFQAAPWLKLIFGSDPYKSELKP